jgi:glyoxylate carboligase
MTFFLPVAFPPNRRRSRKPSLMQITVKLRNYGMKPLSALRSLRARQSRSTGGDCPVVDTCTGAHILSDVFRKVWRRVGLRNWRGLGCAAIVGAAVAFPAGVMFAERETAQKTAGPRTVIDSRAATPIGRRMYSPIIINDPYVRDQHRAIVEALEAQCRNQGQRCAEAKQARRWIDQQKPSE